MKKKCIVIGLGRFGVNVAESLYKLNHDVLAIDIDEDKVRHISDKVSHALEGDIRDEYILDDLGLTEFDIAIVGIGGSMEASCLAIIALKRAGVPIIIAKAKDDTYGKILTTLGATSIVFPEKDIALKLAHNITSHNILGFFELSEEYSLVELQTPSKLIGKSILDSKIREFYHINIIAIKNNSNIIADISPQYIFNESDILLIIGKDINIQNFK